MNGERAGRRRWRAAVARSAGTALCFLAVAAAAAAQNPADEAWDAGDLDRARELYAQRLAADSADAVALHRMALMLGWGEEYDESITLFDRLLRLSPENVDARVARARVLAWKGDLAGAIEDLQALAEAEPGYRPGLEALATFHAWAGRYTPALEILDRVARLDPDDPGVHYQRATVLGWAGRLDAARAVYDSLLAADPGDVRALLGLGQALAWSDRLDSARVVYRAVLELEPDNLEARTGLARTTGFSGDLVAAERSWRELVAANPENVEALLGLGLTLRWQGRDAAARPYFQRIMALDPGNGDAREQLRWVRASLGPRVAPALAYEWDSDGNRILTLSSHGAWHPVPRVEVRLDVYRRSATLGDAITDPRAAAGATLTTQLQLPPGWRVAASAGAGAPDLPGVAGTGAWGLTVVAPARYPVRATLSLGRERLDATAILMANRVVYDQAALNLGARLGPWTVDGAASAAWFRSLVSSEGNRRLAANAAATRPVTPWLDLGGSLRVFGFDRDLNEGYFDPDLFVLLELPAGLSAERGRLTAALGLVPGLQKITADGAIKPAFRTSGSLSWQHAPGRTAALSLVYAANGASPFAEQAADYRYFALNLRGRWVF